VLTHSHRLFDAPQTEAFASELNTETSAGFPGKHLSDPVCSVVTTENCLVKEESTADMGQLHLCQLQLNYKYI